MYSRKFAVPFKRFIIVFLLVFSSAVTLFAETDGPIHIYSETALSEAGFPGAGTAANPYRISGKYIKSEASRVSAVVIENTESFITISGCRIDSAYTGIRIKKAAEGSIIIKNNEINSAYGSGSGISFISIKDCRIEYNTCTGFYRGMNLNTANENSIVNNTITESRSCGINLVASSKNSITANTIQDAPEGGIAAEPYSRLNIIKNNRFLFSETAFLSIAQ